MEKPLPRKVNAFKINVKYMDHNGDTKNLDPISLKVKFCKPSEEPTEEDALVVQQRDRLIASYAQEQAEAFARVGDFNNAQYVLSSCNISDANTNIVLNSLSSNYADATAYSTFKGINNSVRSRLRGSRVSYMPSVATGYIGSSTNSVMDSMEASFLNDSGTEISTTDSSNEDASDKDSNESLKSITSSLNKKSNNEGW